MRQNIRGEWIALDPSANHAELARTDNGVAIRASYQPDEQVNLTDAQFKTVVAAAKSGRLDDVVPGTSTA